MSDRENTSARGADGRPVRIGLPRALLYHRYGVLWETFFDELGYSVVVSPATNKKILDQGADLAIDEACLSAKIFLGHVNWLIGRCDYIFVPRISNYGRRRNFCTRFEAEYDLVCNVFRDSGQEFLGIDIDILNKKKEDDAYIGLGQELGFSKKEATRAYRRARKADAAAWSDELRYAKGQYQEEGIKILVAAHSYVSQDKYFGEPSFDYLESMGVTAIRADVTDRHKAINRSGKLSPTLKWEMSREIVGSIEMNRSKVDGIILTSVYPCGPDSMVNEMITRRVKDTPILNLVLDAQTGTAGLETRLESFIDILKLKKEAEAGE